MTAARKVLVLEQHLPKLSIMQLLQNPQTFPSRCRWKGSRPWVYCSLVSISRKPYSVIQKRRRSRLVCIEHWRSVRYKSDWESCWRAAKKVFSCSLCAWYQQEPSWDWTSLAWEKATRLKLSCEVFVGKLSLTWRILSAGLCCVCRLEVWRFWRSFRLTGLSPPPKWIRTDHHAVFKKPLFWPSQEPRDKIHFAKRSPCLILL